MEDDIIKSAKEAFEAAQDCEQDNRNEALDDLRFARLEEQWPEPIRKQRELDGRPVLTINKLPAHIRQVVNEARINKPAINVHAVDSESDPETAEIISGLIRNIEQSSDAEVAYDTALEYAVTMGFGYFRINTRYARDDAFDQDIVIEREPNPFAIFGDPNSTAADSSDWNVAFKLDAVSRKAFERQYGDAEASSFTDTGVFQTLQSYQGDQVVLAEYWTREDDQREIVALSDGQVIDADVYGQQKDLFDALGLTVIASRVVPSHKVRQRILSGGAVLDEIDWKGRFIPIVPVYGEEFNVEGRRYLRSLVRSAKDPQRMFNYWRTATTELVALAPKAPFIGRKGVFDYDLAKWQTANTESHAFIEYDGAEPPMRQPFAGVPAGALQEALNASDDIKAILGQYDASLGARSNETSGKAIIARQREGDVSTFHYIDNLSRAIRHAGRIIVDLIPHVYSAPRMVRILGPNDEAQMVPVNQPVAVQQQQMVQEQIEAQGELQAMSRIYDLTTGKYDVTDKVGPSFASQREEMREDIGQLIQAMPAAAPVLMDLWVKSMDIPDGEKIVRRLEALLPPQVQGDDPAMAAAQQQMQAMAQEMAKLQAEAQDKQTEAALKAQELQIKAYEAQTDRIEAMAKVRQPYEQTTQ